MVLIQVFQVGLREYRNPISRLRLTIKPESKKERDRGVIEVRSALMEWAQEIGLRVLDISVDYGPDGEPVILAEIKLQGRPKIYFPLYLVFTDLDARGYKIVDQKHDKGFLLQAANLPKHISSPWKDLDVLQPESSRTS